MNKLQKFVISTMVTLVILTPNELDLVGSPNEFAVGIFP